MGTGAHAGAPLQKIVQWFKTMTNEYGSRGNLFRRGLDVYESPGEALPGPYEANPIQDRFEEHTKPISLDIPIHPPVTFPKWN